MGGLVAQQQCVGPLQTPLADVAVVALSHQELVGAATALGEQPVRSLLDPKVAARLAVAEALTNLVFALVTDLRVSPLQLLPCSPRPLGRRGNRRLLTPLPPASPHRPPSLTRVSAASQDVKCSGNWMWAAKLQGEGAALADACGAVAAVMAALGVAVDGGKDSLSMAARVGAETVRAPGELWAPKGDGQVCGPGCASLSTPCSAGSLVISAYAVCPDITATVTPDLKCPGGRGRGSSLSSVHCGFTAGSFVWGLLCECWAPSFSTGAVVPSGAGGLGVSPRPGNFSEHGGRGSPEPPTSPLPFPVSPGHLLYVPLSPGQHRLGGTALAQCFSQLGEQPPDLDLPENLVQAFGITQGLLKGERGPGGDGACGWHGVGTDQLSM